MHPLVKKHAEKLRFGLVGIANTALDFIILFALTALGLDKIAANYISTFVAFIFSFFVNKSFTFRDKGGNVRKQFALFIAVTIAGLWVIQPIVIIVCSWALVPLALPDAMSLFVAKVVATGASLVWNYLFYSRLVFRKRGES